ncbi:MAG TPA: hypothetical protein PKD91_13090 [Bacteroidia bacterium]|nr:hypothetical protein [Bacteroidia bacterium]
MRFASLLIVLVFAVTTGFSQKNPIETKHYKGQFYLYWGWNQDWYTKSDIHFKGSDFDFTLYDVQAHDKQKKFAVDPYLNPLQFTVPQTNFRLGYFINDKYSISLGFDHMKYVVTQYQTVKITGTIENTITDYNGVYTNDDIEINPTFLLYEHTDGLNYINVELRRHHDLFDFNRIGVNNILIKMEEGFGIAGLYPKTDATLLSNPRNDEFHVAGYGMGAHVGLNITFFKHFFLQSELKGGYINMPDIRVTSNKNDQAKQHFYFLQSNFVIGANFWLFKPKPATPVKN